MSANGYGVKGVIYITNLIKKAKDKGAFIESSNFVIFFLLATILCIILFELTMAVFSIYSVNIAATNIARVVAVNGDLTQQESEKLYNLATEQMNGKMIDDTITVTIETVANNTSYVPAQKVVLRKGVYPQYRVNLGDPFTVTIEGEVSLFHIAGERVTTILRGTSYGVGEIYYKYGD